MGFWCVFCQVAFSELNSPQGNYLKSLRFRLRKKALSFSFELAENRVVPGAQGTALATFESWPALNPAEAPRFATGKASTEAGSLKIESDDPPAASEATPRDFREEASAHPAPLPRVEEKATG